METKLQIFPCQKNKAPIKGFKWQDTEETITLKELIESKNLKYKHCAVRVPVGFSVYDFDCPKGVDIELFKEKVLMLIPECSNLKVETTKGIHLWIKGDIAQTAKKINYLGLQFDIRNHGGYVVVQQDGTKRNMLGSANHHSWSGINIEGVSLSSLNSKEKALFDALLKGHDFNGERNDTMFKVYKPFLIQHFNYNVFNQLLKAGINFNQLWGWDLPIDEIKTIMTKRKKEETGELFRGRTITNVKKMSEDDLDDDDWEIINACPFVMSIRADIDALESEKPYKLVIRKKPNSHAMIHFERAVKLFYAEHKHRLKLLNHTFFIIEADGVWNSNKVSQQRYLRDWLAEKKGLVAKGDIDQFHDQVVCDAEVVETLMEQAYLINNNQVLIKECEIVPFDNKKHQVLAKIPLKLIEKDKIDKKRVEKFITFFNEIIKNKKEVQTLLSHIRYLFMPTKKAKKMLLLEGVKHSGKSTLCSLIRKGLGHDKVRVVQLGALLGERFGTSEIIGSVMFYDDDVAGFFEKANLGLFKSIISNNVVRVEFKYEAVYNEVISGKLWACSNSTLGVQNKEGVDNRIDIIETKKIPADKKKAFIEDDFTKTDFSHFFSWLIYKKKYSIAFLSDDLINEAKVRFLIKNNSVFRFLYEDEDDLNYGDYAEWSRNHGYKPLNLDKFEDESERWFREYSSNIKELKKRVYRGGSKISKKKIMISSNNENWD